MVNTMTELRTKLSSQDHFLLAKLRAHLAVEGKTTFSSDDFRAMGLDKFLYGDPTHAIGAYFYRLLKNDEIEEVGRVRSDLPTNRMREIRLYEFKKVK